MIMIYSMLEFQWDSKSKLLSRFLNFGLSVEKLKSPNKKKFSYEELKKFNESLIIYERKLILWR